MDTIGPRALALLAAACLLPMALAAAVLVGLAPQHLEGTIDDAAGCEAAGGRHLVAADECAFADPVVVEAGHTLVLAGDLAWSFRRDLDVEGTLVAEGVVTTPDDVTVDGVVQVRGAGEVRTVSSLRAGGR